ncbi:hypothetical protein ACIO3O_37215 [Streptomyces sp. NPDC087440]|uniref:hypothetical protein n=1 Tax=Streptomyces sp. NPDC087440 TaxID=3365790 RepID=UPI0038217481
MSSSTMQLLTTGAGVGALLPLLTAIVQRPRWSAQQKQAVAMVAALIAGVATVATVGGWQQFQSGQLTATFLAVLAAAQTSYDLLWKPTALAPLIEGVTTRKDAKQAE